MAANGFAISRAECGHPQPANNGITPSHSGFLPWLQPNAGSHSAGEPTSDDALVRLFRAIGHYHSISELTSVLAAEAAPLIQLDCLGILRRNDATPAVEWHLAIPGTGMTNGSTTALT